MNEVEQKLKDLDKLNKHVGTRYVDNMLRWFCSKYPYTLLSFQLFTNKYVIVNNKGARIL